MLTLYFTRCVGREFVDKCTLGLLVLIYFCILHAICGSHSLCNLVRSSFKNWHASKIKYRSSQTFEASVRPNSVLFFVIFTLS